MFSAEDMAANSSQLQSSYQTLSKNHSLLKDEVQMLKNQTAGEKRSKLFIETSAVKVIKMLLWS